MLTTFSLVCRSCGYRWRDQQEGVELNIHTACPECQSLHLTVSGTLTQD